MQMIFDRSINRFIYQRQYQKGSERNDS
jgi:hypothetical protein